MDNGFNMQELGMRRPKSPELKRRNRRVGWIALAVIVFLIAGSAFYIAEWGGTNKGGAKPFWMEQGAGK